MALRNVRIKGDPILRKKSRTIEVLDDKNKELIADLKETMVEEGGVGIAAVQVGILKRIIIIDPYAGIDDEDEDAMKNDAPILPFEYEGSFALINPEIIEMDGEAVIMKEGCLSVPEEEGYVKRPSHIKVKAKTEDFEEVVFDAYDYFARVICHEVDHTNGILFTDKLEDIPKKINK